MEEFIIAVSPKIRAIDKIFLSGIAKAGTPEEIFENYFGTEDITLIQHYNIHNVIMQNYVIMNAIISDDLERQALIEMVDEGKVIILEGDER